METNRYIKYETLDEGLIARITLDRPRTRNAQNRGLLVELNDAFLQAEADDTVRVVILCGAGPLFSSGHDMGSRESAAEREPGPDRHPSFAVNGGAAHAAPPAPPLPPPPPSAGGAGAGGGRSPGGGGGGTFSSITRAAGATCA